MIRLWQLTDDGDIVRFKFQVEEDNPTGIVMYSRSRKATGYGDSIFDGYPASYSYRIRKHLFETAKEDVFPKQYTIAWY